jgi:hypothetical protein
MADYDRRLQRLEHRIATDGLDELSEALRKRSSEFMKRMDEIWGPEELPAGRPSDYDPEFKAEWAAWQAEHAEELAKARQFFASLALRQGTR